MNDGLIPRRYAKALYKFAFEKGYDATVYRLMTDLCANFAAQPALQSTMANPFVTDRAKQQLVVTACGLSKPDKVLADFLHMLADNKRLPMLYSIALAYLDTYRHAHNIHQVTVTSAVALDKATQKRITDVIQKQIGSDGSMEYSSIVDPDIIGGFIVAIDNDRLDASIATELKQLKLNLLQ